jgi:ABC-type multidrug transport system fused ATPase/permease subunit
MSDPARVSLLRILRLHPRRTASVTVLLALAGAAEGIGLLSFLPVLEAVGSGGGETTRVGRAIEAGLGFLGVRPTLGALLSAILLALFLKAAFRWVAMAQVGTAVAAVAAELRMRLLRALLGASWSHFAGQAAGRAAGALSRDAFWAAFAYRDACASLAAILQLAVYAAAVLLLSWKLGLLAVAVGIGASAPLGLWVRVSRRAGARQTRHAEALVTRLVDVLQVIKPVKAMGREPAFLAALEEDTAALRRAEADHVRATEALRALQEPLLALVVLGVLFAALARGGDSLPTVLVLALLFQRMVGRFHVAQSEYQAMAAAASAYASIEAQIGEAEGGERTAPGDEGASSGAWGAGRCASSRVALTPGSLVPRSPPPRPLAGEGECAASSVQESGCCSARSDYVVASLSEPGEGPFGVLPPTLSLRDVRFRHRGRPVLDGVSLVVPAGSFVAIVGTSGAGKSTLLDLLAGLREPEAGEVRVDGVPLGSVDPEAWHCRLGYLPQESVLLHESLLDNVLLGARHPSASDVSRALGAAGAGALLATLPRGLATRVGERGLRLSGGERRRIALARALVGSPDLLLLDEPTSELDADSSAALSRTLLSLRGAMTIVAVTHDPALAAAADRVYLLDGGRLTPHGAAGADPHAPLSFPLASPQDILQGS